MNVKKSKNTPNRYIVSNPDEPSYLAARCISCNKLRALDFIKNEECIRCTQSSAA
ncbi:hypothetical protein HQP42_09025 [Rhodococcus fascians]|jgi:hypothetical protein|nr:hypothetical protein [Rhodococcus fascians]MBY3825486.1 hypothetical protein [Rhodococcus fascians]MBY3835948.1 hypothetical protein [Rhodococcus fascians]MBY3865160.1 hypothetical protein [Rhodococcus fascians]MBY3884438.1 hypothetical protein [Rhodococcus fascians]